MVGGSIADIWMPHEYAIFLYVAPIFTHLVYRRGLPMSFFALVATSTIGVGPIMGGWVEMNEKLQWRWIEWIGMMYVCLSRSPSTNS